MALLTNAQFLEAFSPLLSQRIAATITEQEFSDAALLLYDDWILGGARVARLASEVSATVTFENRAVQTVSEWYAGTPTGGPNNDGMYPLYNSEGEVFLVPSPAKLVQVIAKGDPGRDARHNTIISIQYALETSEETPPYSPPENVVYDATLSFCYARTNTQVTTTVIQLLMNGVSWGTATFAAGQLQGTVAFANPNHARGDLLTARGPATVAPGLSNIGITLAGATED